MQLQRHEVTPKMPAWKQKTQLKRRDWKQKQPETKRSKSVRNWKMRRCFANFEDD